MSYWNNYNWNRNYGRSSTNSNTCSCGKSIKKGQTMCGSCKSGKVTKIKNTGTRHRNMKTCRHCKKKCNAKKMYDKLCRICHITMEKNKERIRITELRNNAINKVKCASHVCVKCHKNKIRGKYICNECTPYTGCANCFNKNTLFTGFLDLRYCSRCFSEKAHLECFCKHVHSKCEGQFNCCVCRGKVPFRKEGTYEQYVDEVGMVECGERWDKFCPTCKEFFVKLVVGQAKIFTKENEQIDDVNPVVNPDVNPDVNPVASSLDVG